ncbi:uncharacterized protein LOC131255562 isoform X1 [Magnolia sinica]|uniref:uncharacterized protein LOC131255562 isoform X1 n=1 Tax=Magnolia sinica TaxID=86752 RepID=UPI002657C6F1|nr:uncharacterized protein LOC131255562 isoform X1 [Magnolia sinica]XP_058112291.1 uncharacterized protein LOC131255562 isoform X1 [Magnolia sinica]
MSLLMRETQWDLTLKNGSFLRVLQYLFHLLLIHLLQYPSCLRVEPKHTVLVHAAARGVGSLLCHWAHAFGATVIGIVSTEAKAAQAAEDGCHRVIIYNKEDFVSRVDEITFGEGVNVVYDSIEKDTFQVKCFITKS